MKYNVGDKVLIKSIDWYKQNKDENGSVLCNYNYYFTRLMTKYCGEVMTIKDIINVPLCRCYMFEEDEFMCHFTDDMIEEFVEEETKPKDMGEVSDGYHTFNELYEYRMLYNAAFFNELAKQGLYDVHKSRKHSDGEYPFGDSNWFIVMAELPTGQISNHYEMKDWDKFQIPEKEVANKWDEHSPRDVAERLTSFTSPKKEYPKTYEECLSVLGIYNGLPDVEIYNAKPSECKLFESLIRLKRCRDAYWKIAGDKLGIGEPWKPDYTKERYIICKWVDEILTGYRAGGFGERFILEFPTEEMRDAFYENFKELIEKCKELL